MSKPTVSECLLACAQELVQEATHRHGCLYGAFLREQAVELAQIVARLGLTGKVLTAPYEAPECVGNA
jgi:hypothetical protein